MTTRRLRIGIDLDNTLACYETVFAELARARGLVLPGANPSRIEVRRRLRADGLEHVWTEMQGEAYGPRMQAAELFAGAREFIELAIETGAEIFIVSHRTRHPYRGPAHDLHGAARRWLESSGLVGAESMPIRPANVFLEPTLSDKLARIAALECTHFIDDLPELFDDARFPAATVPILFGDAADGPGAPPARRARTWNEVAAYVLGTAEQDDDGDERMPALARRLVAAATGAEIVGVEGIRGGRNNRAYRVDTPGRAFFLKAYHTDAADPWPRLRTELTFLTFAWTHGIRSVPEPIAADEENNLGLYGFIDGRRLAADEIAATHIDEAGRFIAALNQHRDAPHAAALPAAAEACFAFADHLRIVDERVRRLRAIDGDDAVDAEARAFVSDRLQPLWQRLSLRVHAKAAAAGLDDGTLQPRQLCLSPSDFGFHNALQEGNGGLIFHDFEYAGWDDPAKLVCDFLCQPDVPVPEPLAADARAALLAGLTDSAAAADRCQLLLPVYLLKWSCICLNDFLPIAARRRRFAAAASSDDGQRRAQLTKAIRLLNRVERL